MDDNVIPTLSDILAGRGTRAVAAGEVRRYNLSVRGMRQALHDIENDTGRRPYVCFAQQGQVDALLAEISTEQRIIAEPGAAKATTPEEAALGLRFALDIVGLRVLVADEVVMRQTQEWIAASLAKYGDAVASIGAAKMVEPGRVSVPVVLSAAIEKMSMTFDFGSN